MHFMTGGAYEFFDRHFWIVAACCCAAVVIFSTLADRRRNRRTRLEDVGFMPWTGMTVAGVLLTTVAIAFALKAELNL
jgi:hypothetical protein